jgi:phosphatidylethanolamine-binding protein (PEBP) family uncharacterized protein
MRRATRAAAIVALLSVLALTGCGTSSTTSGKVASVPPNTSSTAAGAHPTTSSKIASVRLASSAIQHGQLPARYTCAGEDISPPLTWGAVPSTIQELALFALESAPGAPGQPIPGVEWVMAGVKPALHHINAGALPRGAFLLNTGTGKIKYSLCPPKGQTKHYAFALYAIPAGVHITPELSGIALLTNLTNNTPGFQSPAIGTITATYTRR